MIVIADTTPLMIPPAVFKELLNRKRRNSSARGSPPPCLPALAATGLKTRSKP
jgi:hypothetical protein